MFLDKYFIHSYRIKYAMRENMLRKYSPKNDILILEDIRYAVDLHRQAMKLVSILQYEYKCLVIFLICFKIIQSFGVQI